MVQAGAGRYLIGCASLLGLLPQETAESRVEKWVKQLESPRRLERLAARRELLSLGQEILPLVDPGTRPLRTEEGRRSLRYVREHLPRSPETAEIAAGTYLVGSDEPEDRSPVRSVKLAAYRIDRTEVTCFEYSRFVETTGTPPPPDWPFGHYPYRQEQFPVRNVSYQEAQQFCHWRGGRLPAADEWEVAGHLGSGDAYPWGASGEPVLLANATGRLVPVASEPLDLSPAGCFDLSASVMEWVTDPQGRPAFRGGHFGSRRGLLRLTRAPTTSPSGDRRSLVGFRVVDRDLR